MGSLNGVLVVDKPAGWTSFDVLAKLRGVLHTRKLGHSGTLDPMATGVLPVFVGPARKAVDLQTDHNKEYEAVIRLGVRTDTGDVTGTVVETAPVTAGETELQAVLPRFVGPQMQLPPMYSAVKVGGVPLYKAARQGKEVARTPRPVVIHELAYLGRCGENEYRLRVFCGKGTYVRVLLEEIGAALGTVATMAALRRTRAGAYTLADSHTLEAILAAGEDLPGLLIGLDTVFASLPALTADAATVARLANGAPTWRCGRETGRYRVYGPDEAFLGVGRVDADGALRAEKLFIERG